MRFKEGDRVELVGNLYRYKTGDTGTICSKAHALVLKDELKIEMDKDISGHNCGGAAAAHRGLYANSNQIRLIRPKPRRPRQVKNTGYRLRFVKGDRIEDEEETLTFIKYDPDLCRWRNDRDCAGCPGMAIVKERETGVCLWDKWGSNISCTYTKIPTEAKRIADIGYYMGRHESKRWKLKRIKTIMKGFTNEQHSA